MKLYLSSYKLGDNPERLRELSGKNKRIGIIANSLDQFSDLNRRSVTEETWIEELQKLGFQPEVLDLRNYFDKHNELQEKMNELGGVWVLGGNTFVLRYAMHQSGMDVLLRKYSESKPEFLYAGFSAGGCVLQKDITGVSKVDDPAGVEIAYQTTPIMNGVGIISFAFVPHFKSNHPESEKVEDMVKFYEENKIPFKTLHDGEVLIGDSKDL